MGTGVPPGLQNQSPRRSRRRGVGSIPTRFRHILSGVTSPSSIRLPVGERPAFIAIPLIAIPLLGILRSFHESTPHLPFVPGPFGSLLFVATLALGALHAVQRQQNRDLMPDIERGPGLTIAMTLPILVVALAEKWVAIDLLSGAYGWIDARVTTPARADAIYRLWTGLAMAGTALALHRVLRQSARKIERLVVPRRVTEAIIVFVPAAAGAALLVVALPVWIGGVRTGVRDVPLDTLALIGIAQVVRATAEEIFFRGLLQTALMRLLWQAGVPQGRLAAGIAVVVVSTGFTLEHVDPGLAFGEQIGSLVWVFSMSVLLGVLLEASRNLYLVIAAHALVNLVLAGVVPMPLSPEGQLLIDPEAPALLALVFMFVGLVVSHRRRGF